MANFGKLLGKGQQRHKIKSRKSKWGRCEHCDNRSPLFPLYDIKRQVWMLCETCTDVLADEDME